MPDYPTDLSQLVQRDGGPLVCHGCAHSASSTPYPGRPSGERPCCFCTRNVKLDEWRKNGGRWMKDGQYNVTFTPRYDNKPVKKAPLDCYIATDYLVDVVSARD